jgi:hypothetical protein
VGFENHQIKAHKEGGGGNDSELTFSDGIWPLVELPCQLVLASVQAHSEPTFYALTSPFPTIALRTLLSIN